MADPAIKLISTPYQEVLALLHSEALRNVEQAIAAKCGVQIVEDYSTTCTMYTQGDMSVSGMTVAETEAILLAQRDQIIHFGIAFLREQKRIEGAKKDTIHELGLGVGFGIKYAIYYNFLANRTPAEFRAYLKNRRISQHSKFARELRRVFDEVQARPSDSTAAE